METTSTLQIQPNAMANPVLPEDIVVCILTRLPVKSILRFKSVCKPWLQLLSTPEFVKLHYAQFSSDPKNECFFIDSFGPMSLLNVESRTILDLPCPDNVSGTARAGCCNGLICVGGLLVRPGDIVLWNPAMKLIKFVGLSRPVDLTKDETPSLGFGYDAEMDDYKVVRIVYFEVGEEEDMEMDRVEVYSVNSDSWITIDDPGFQFRAPNDMNIVVVNGNPYWVAEVHENGSAKNVLVCFDVKKMVFRIVPLSGPINEDAGFVEWNGSLGALVCTIIEGEWVVKSIDVWVFDDGEQIWRKNRSFVPPLEMKNSELQGWKLLGSKNGKIIVMCLGGPLFVFDSDIGCIKKVDLAELYAAAVYPYTESLAYIEGMEHERLLLVPE